MTEFPAPSIEFLLQKKNDQLFQHLAPTGPCSTFLGAHLGDTVCLCVRHTGPLCRCGYGG